MAEGKARLRGWTPRGLALEGAAREGDAVIAGRDASGVASRQEGLHSARRLCAGGQPFDAVHTGVVGQAEASAVAADSSIAIGRYVGRIEVQTDRRPRGERVARFEDLAT